MCFTAHLEECSLVGSPERTAADETHYEEQERDGNLDVIADADSRRRRTIAYGAALIHNLTEAQRHSLTHYPALKGCKVCERAKLRKYPSKTKQEEERRRATKINQFGHLDTIGPITPVTVHRERLFLFSMDDLSELVKISLERSKEADETRLSFLALHPKIDRPETLILDGGGEFAAEFEDMRATEGLAKDESIPNRSSTNARQSRKHHLLQGMTRAALDESGAPTELWGYALLHVVHNYNNTPQGPEPKIPVKEHYGVNPAKNLLPFGTGCAAFDESVTLGEKFLPRGFEAAILGYGMRNSYKCVELKEIGSMNRFSVKTVRDVRVRLGEFPMKTLNFRPLQPSSFVPIVETPYKCTDCGLWIAANESITCASCLGRKRAHEEGVGCLQQRCKCGKVVDSYFSLDGGHDEDDEEEDDGGADGDDGDGGPHPDGVKKRPRRSEEASRGAGSSSSSEAPQTADDGKSVSMEVDDDEDFRSARSGSGAKSTAKSSSKASERSEKQQKQQKQQKQEKPRQEQRQQEGRSSSSSGPRRSPRGSPGLLRSIGEKAVEVATEIAQDAITHAVDVALGSGGGLLGPTTSVPLLTVAKETKYEGSDLALIGMNNSFDDLGMDTEDMAEFFQWYEELNAPEIGNFEFYESMEEYEELNDHFVDVNDGSQETCCRCGIGEHNETLWACRAEGGCRMELHDQELGVKMVLSPNEERLFCGTCLYEHGCDNGAMHTPGPEMQHETRHLAVFRQAYGEELLEPGPRAAEEKEIAQLNGRVFDMGEPVEASDVRRYEPDALHVDLHLVTGEQFSEMQLPEESRVWKSRLVAGGNRLRDARGQAVKEKSVHEAPVSFDETRSALFSAQAQHGGTVRRGDVRGAYTTAALGGRAVYARVPKRHHPTWWQRMWQPVVRLYMALYGLERSDRGWQVKRDADMVEAGWLKERPSVFSKWFPVEHVDPQTGGTYLRMKKASSSIYTDDFFIGGGRPAADAAFDELNQILGFSGSTADEPFIGLNITEVYEIVGGTCTFVDQGHLSKAVVGRYKDELGKTKLKPAMVPGVHNRGERTMVGGDEPGVMAKTCRRHVCGLLYVCRGSRPDLSFAVCAMSRRLHDWRKIDDRRLEQVMCYLESFPDLGLRYEYYHEDEGELRADLWCDTDHGGDLATSKSTSGTAFFLCGKFGSRCLAAFSAKLQDYVALSSGEAETIGVVHSLRRVGFPGLIVAEQLFDDRQPYLPLRVNIDNSARRSCPAPASPRK